MKTLLTVCLIAVTAFAGKAQDADFNETVTHIETLYKAEFKFGRGTITSVKCEGNIFIKTFSDGKIAKTDLLTIKSLLLEREYDGSKWHLMFINTAGVATNEYLLGHIQSEQAALDLKQSMEKLIAMVKKKKKLANS